MVVKLCEHGLTNKAKCSDCVMVMKEKITCGCGSCIQSRSMKAHLQSMKHKRWVEEKKEPEPQPEPEPEPEPEPVKKEPETGGECQKCSYLRLRKRADYCNEHDPHDDRCFTCHKRNDNCACWF